MKSAGLYHEVPLMERYNSKELMREQYVEEDQDNNNDEILKA